MLGFLRLVSSLFPFFFLLLVSLSGLLCYSCALARGSPRCSAPPPPTIVLPTTFPCPCTAMDHRALTITTVLAFHKLVVVFCAFTKSIITVNSMVTSSTRRLTRHLVGIPLMDYRRGTFAYQPKQVEATTMSTGCNHRATGRGVDGNRLLPGRMIRAPTTGRKMTLHRRIDGY